MKDYCSRRYVIGIYSESCNRKRPVIERADMLFGLLEDSRMANGLAEIDYAGESSDHGDFSTVIDTVEGLMEYAAMLRRRAHPGAAGQYTRAVAKGIREAVEVGDLLAVEGTSGDPRYVDSDDARARLTAYWGELPMGGWTDDDEPAFRDAVIAQLSEDLLPDGSATPDEIRDGLKITNRETTTAFFITGRDDNGNRSIAAKRYRGKGWASRDDAEAMLFAIRANNTDEQLHRHYHDASSLRVDEIETHPHGDPVRTVLPDDGFQVLSSILLGHP